MLPSADTFQQYKLLRRENGALWEVGRSADGIAYKAHDTTLEVAVALTVINAALVDSDAAYTDIMQRAKTIASLKDAHSSSFIFFGKAENVAFYVRPFVEGASVAQFVERFDAIEWQEALRITREIALCLDENVKRNVLHGNLSIHTVILHDSDRDLSNPLLPSREVRLVDFALTNAQLLNVRADLRALGQVLLHMLEGRPVPEPGFYAATGTTPVSNAHSIHPVHPLASELAQQLLNPDDGSWPQTPHALVRRIEELITERPSVIPKANGEVLSGNGRLPNQDFIDVQNRPVMPLSPKTDIANAEAEKQVADVDENLQFTAYRPKTVRPGTWTKMLVFAHLEDRPDWLDESERAPHEEVAAQAQQLLGSNIHEYRQSTDDSRLAVPRDGEITLLPEIDGIEFNPPRRSFFWRDGIAVHAESFDLRARLTHDGKVARGRITIFLGRIILAEISLAIRVDSSYVATSVRQLRSSQGDAQERSGSRAFRKVFASYSHKDLGIVEEMERHARSFGDEYLRDWVHLRSGERWNDGLQALIRAADVFQLFWSPDSARSEFVAREWQYALALGRDTFVRPTYWYDPMPDPPELLKPLHFHRLAVNVGGALPAMPLPETSLPLPAPPQPTAPSETKSYASMPYTPTPPAPPPDQRDSPTTSAMPNASMPVSVPRKLDEPAHEQRKMARYFAVTVAVVAAIILLLLILR